MADFTPSIKLEHADSRGEIYSIQLPNGHELMLLHSTPGSFRGGHSHTCGEIVTMLAGKMRYHRLDCPTFNMLPGASSYNEAGLEHMGEFLEDTWLIEYKLAKKGDWSQTDYEPYRKQVRESQQ